MFLEKRKICCNFATSFVYNEYTYGKITILEK